MPLQLRNSEDYKTKLTIAILCVLCR